MKLKQNVVMVLILMLLLGSIGLGIALGDPKAEKPVEPEVVEDVIPETFKGSIKGGEKIPQEVMDVLINYMDDYFLSMYTLQLQDTTGYFKEAVDGDVSNAAIKMIVESRKLYDFDFTMSAAHYDLDITQCVNSNEKYVIDFLEDDFFCFKFLNGITSESYGVENYMTIEKVNDEYKISSYEKVQGYYMMFNDSKDVDDMSRIYEYYFDRLKATIDDENYKKSMAEANPYFTSKTYDVKYDRTAAANYASTYCHTRNEEYYDFSDEGGNCQNMASQALIAGGMIMDDSGDCQWYYNDHLDYVAPWVHVQSFNDYCRDNVGKGLVCDVNKNVYYAEIGDLIQVGIGSISHTTVVSKIVDGHILLNSNSIDMKDFPLEAYTYPIRKLIKILGSNS